MKIAIVILNWNGRTLLERFLPSVIGSSAALADIIIADNASTDDSVPYCEAHFPDLRIVKNTVNGGYAKGYNDALAQVEADLYVLLNSDVQTPSGWLEPMIALFKNDAQLGAAQPKILDLQNKTHFEYAGAAGGYVDALGYPYCRGRIFDHCEKDEGQYNDTIEVEWASGSCLFVRASVFNEVGGFDEDYFAHQEEIDLCSRIKNVNYKVMACGDSAIYHLGGATLSSQDPRKTFYNFRNSLYNIVKNERGAFVKVFLRLLLDGVAGVRFLLKGKFLHCWAILKSHLSFYCHLPSMHRKRRPPSLNKQKKHPYSIIFAYFIQKHKRFSDL